MKTEAAQTEATAQQPTAVCAVTTFASAVAEEDVAVRNTCRLGLDVASLNDVVLFAMTVCSRAVLLVTVSRGL